MSQTPWFDLLDAAGMPSPGLLVYRARVDENLRRMVALAGGAARLRPHVKTHKLPPLVQAQLALGIRRFKAATIAEAAMTAAAGAGDVLLAYQPVGPNIERLAALAENHPGTKFSALVDNDRSAREIASAFEARGRTLPLFVDVDTGMHRSGIEPAGARRLYGVLADLRGVRTAGLHAYDGHLRDPDPLRRRAACDQAFEPVATLRDRLRSDGYDVPVIVAGGSPTFLFHAGRDGVECSPGTTVFWDAGYAQLRDLPFEPAALVITRVVSKPGGSRVCLDLGHKAIASENPHPRVVLHTAGEAAPLECTFVGHSEEHLVIETPAAHALGVGDVLYGVPWHICPTVALYDEAVVVEEGRVTGTWQISRGRASSVPG